jgi:hypothetical protein
VTFSRLRLRRARADASQDLHMLLTGIVGNLDENKRADVAFLNLLA